MFYAYHFGATLAFENGQGFCRCDLLKYEDHVYEMRSNGRLTPDS